MSAEKTIVLNVRLSAPVKERLNRDADEQEANINDVGVAIIADHFGIKFEGTGRRSRGAHTPEGAVLFRVPNRVYARVEAAKNGRPKGSRSKTAVVEAIFREHYQLDAAHTVAV